MPLIVITGLLLAAGVLWSRNHRPAAALACAVGALSFGVLWVHGAYYFNDGCPPSTNGVRVNGAATLSCELKHGDRIEIGESDFQYVVQPRVRQPREGADG